MRRNYSISVSGKVQGVFFRKFTVKEAHRLGIKGYVKNETNGDVFVEAEGEEDDLNKFMLWCKTGSPMSKVTSVLLVEEGNIKGYDDFKIAT